MKGKNKNGTLNDENGEKRRKNGTLNEGKE